jgi:MoxR-like ATPase
VDVLIQEYVVKLVDTTRHHPSVYLGGSPRASLALQRLGQAQAILDGRDYVLPDDVKRLAYPTLAHRVILNAQARVKGITERQAIQECVDRVPVPGVRPRSG